MFWKRKKRHKAQELDEQTFYEKIQKEQKVFIFFVAPWCGACKMLKPIIHELADENKDSVFIGMVNTDYEQKLSQQFHIMSLPSLIVFKEGKITYQGTGMISKPRLQEMMESL